MNQQSVIFAPGSPLLQKAPAASGVDFADLLGVIWRRKIILAAAMLLCAAGAYLSAALMTRQFSSTAQVMLDPRERRVLQTENVVSALNVTNSAVASEVAVLRSNVLLEKVVDELSLHLRPEVNPALAAPPLSVRLKAALLGLFDRRSDGSAESAPAENLGERAAVVGRLQGMLTIRQDGISYIIGVTATTSDAELAAAIANGVVRRYIRDRLDDRMDATRRATLWLQERVEELQEQVETAEAAVELHRARNLVLLGGSPEAAGLEVGALSGQIGMARARRAAAAARYDQVKAVYDEEGPVAAASVASSEMLNTLRQRRALIVQEIANTTSSYGGLHPRSLRLAAELERIDATLVEEIGKHVESLRNDYEAATVEVESLETSLRAVEGRILEISRSSGTLRQVEREAAAIRRVYESMLGRLKETRAQEQLQQTEVRVVSRAEISAAPSWPRRGMLTALGGVAGLFGGLLVVFYRELRSQTFRSAPQLEEETGLSVMAVTPRIRARRIARVLDDIVANPHSAFAERMRQIRAALAVGEGGGPVGVVLIASALAREGKASTALGLAHMAVRIGKSAVVVDCDLRRPSLAPLLARRGGAGPDLANVLLDGAAIEDATVALSAAGVDLLGAARPAPQAADAIASPAFAALTAELSRRYDLVLFVGPPVLLVSDACVIARHVDAALLLVRWDRTTRVATREALSMLSRDGRTAPGAGGVAGLVLTMAEGAAATSGGGARYYLKQGSGARS